MVYTTPADDFEYLRNVPLPIENYNFPGWSLIIIEKHIII